MVIAQVVMAIPHASHNAEIKPRDSTPSRIGADIKDENQSKAIEQMNTRVRASGR